MLVLFHVKCKLAKAFDSFDHHLIFLADLVGLKCPLEIIAGFFLLDSTLETDDLLLFLTQLTSTAGNFHTLYLSIIGK
jgi:hypothetical protein